MSHSYLNGELTPYNYLGMKGCYTGINASHTTGHFTQATLEGITLN